MKKVHSSIRAVCLLLLAAAVLTGVGVSFGRYSSQIRDTLLFQAAPKEESRAITIHAPSGWQVTDQRATLTFSLVSSADDQRATLCLTATEGFSTDGSVTLTVDGVTYTAVPQRVVQGDPLYDKMGAGMVYRFDDAGAERVWSVSADTTYTLTVTGQADASLLRLTATEA